MALLIIRHVMSKRCLNGCNCIDKKNLKEYTASLKSKKIPIEMGFKCEIYGKKNSIQTYALFLFQLKLCCC